MDKWMDSFRRRTTRRPRLRWGRQNGSWPWVWWTAGHPPRHRGADWPGRGL